MEDWKKADLITGIFNVKDLSDEVYEAEEFNLGQYGKLRYVEAGKLYFCMTDMYSIWQNLDSFASGDYVDNLFKRKFHTKLYNGRSTYVKEINFICELDLYMLRQRIKDGPFKSFLNNLINRVILKYRNIDITTWELTMERDFNELVLSSTRNAFRDPAYKEWTAEYVNKPAAYLAETLHMSNQKVLGMVYKEIKDSGIDLDSSISNYKEQRKLMYARNGYTALDYETEMASFSTLYFIYTKESLRWQFQLQMEKLAKEYGYETNNKGGQCDKLVTE